MIHLIDHNNRHLYHHKIEEMHRQRYEHFIVARSWGALNNKDGLEIDDYDDEHAIYLLALDDDDHLAISARFRQADPSGLLADHFPTMVADGPSAGPGVFECTRYLVAPAYRGLRGFEYRSKLHAAILELMQDVSARRLLGFTDVQLVLHMTRVSGLSIRPVGLPTDYEEGTALAFEFTLGPDALDDCRRALNLRSRQLFRAPSWLSDGQQARVLAQTTSVLLNGDVSAKAPLMALARDIASTIRAQADPAGTMAALLARAA